MAAYLLDTNHLSPCLQPVSSLRDRLGNSLRLGNRFVTIVPVLFEIQAGLATGSIDEPAHLAL